MENEELLLGISKDLQIIPAGNFINKQILVNKINELITSDFQQLVSILYQVDVSEEKLKQVLKESPGTDAAAIILDLMIERQTKKNKSRREYKRDENISDDEKW